ncbi:MAG: T9SS type A sorting domain-containing protein, partial [Bacteroidota bacterium]
LQKDCSLHLYDALGCLQLHLDQPDFFEECTLDAQHLPAGLYYLVVQQAGKVVRRERVIIQQ